jgi:NAD(P)-dependent dehydrogenase (short-subunit alcohol dehydrogenase family)
MDVAGKVAFITGGASGMGFGMAQAFLAAGMKVAIADIRQEHLDQAMAELGPGWGADVHAIQLDVTDRQSMDRAADQVERAFGKVHVLCNNAGIGVIGRIVDYTYDDWEWMLDVNLTGVFNGVRTFLPRILAHGEGGHIMSTASAGGLFVGDKGGPYSTAKFGVVAMMCCLRDDLAPDNIGVSVLCPGAVRTNIHKTAELRPARYAVSSFAPGEVIAGQSPEEAEAEREMMNAMAMDPLEVGEKVLAAIRANQLYVIPQPMQQIVTARRDAILASLPDEPVNQERLAADLAVRELFRSRTPFSSIG